MKITDAQKATVEQEWGAEANNILELIGKKKGKCNIFKEDGTLAKTKEEVVTMLTKEPKQKVVKKEVSWKDTINALTFDELMEVKTYVSNIIDNKKAQKIAELEEQLRVLKGE